MTHYNLLPTLSNYLLIDAMFLDDWTNNYLPIVGYFPIEYYLWRFTNVAVGIGFKVILDYKDNLLFLESLLLLSVSYCSYLLSYLLSYPSFLLLYLLTLSLSIISDYCY